MSLTKRINRVSKDGTTYHKYEVRIPPDIVKQLGWKHQQKLKFTIDRKRLIIEKE